MCPLLLALTDAVKFVLRCNSKVLKNNQPFRINLFQISRTKLKINYSSQGVLHADLKCKPICDQSFGLLVHAVCHWYEDLAVSLYCTSFPTNLLSEKGTLVL